MEKPGRICLCWASGGSSQSGSHEYPLGDVLQTIRVHSRCEERACPVRPQFRRRKAGWAGDLLRGKPTQLLCGWERFSSSQVVQCQWIGIYAVPREGASPCVQMIRIGPVQPYDLHTVAFWFADPGSCHSIIQDCDVKLGESQPSGSLAFQLLGCSGLGFHVTHHKSIFSQGIRGQRPLVACSLFRRAAAGKKKEAKPGRQARFTPPRVDGAPEDSDEERTRKLEHGMAISREGSQGNRPQGNRAGFLFLIFYTGRVFFLSPEPSQGNSKVMGSKREASSATFCLVGFQAHLQGRAAEPTL